MAVTQAIPITRHPYADGSYKQMLIDGKWVDAASGKNFETHNPATGELLATVAEGDAEDINRAVAAARRAFEGPVEQGQAVRAAGLLLKLADLVEKNFEELSQLDTLDMGAPISRTRANKLRVLGMLRYYAGQATALHGETIENSLPGEIFSYTLKEPVGVVGAIIPWNGPLGASDLEDRSGDRDRLHRGAEARRRSAADLAAARRAVHGSRHSARRRQRGARLWRDRGRGAGLASRRRQGRLHRLACHRASRSSAPRPATSSASRSSSAASRRTSCSPMPISMRRCRARRWRCSPIPARSAAPARGCSSSSKIYDEFVGRVAEFGKKLQVGNGLDPNTQIGPLVSQQQLERVTGYLDIGQKEGAEALAGGARLTEGALSKGYFVPPTVFANVQDNMRIAQEEIFGPVISAISFKDMRRADQARQRHHLRPRQRRVDHAMSARRTRSRRRCAPARSGSIATRRWTRRCRSAATR